MATVRTLIKSALRTIGVVSSGEQPAASEVKDALDYLKQMLSSWQTETLMVPAYVRESFILINQRDYTIGPGLDFDTVQPMQVISAYIQDPTGLQRRVTVTTRNQYDAIPIKDVDSNWPAFLYYDPTGLIRFTSITVPGDQLVLTMLKPFNQDTVVLDEALEFPDQYARAIRLGLAIELAPEYGKQIDQVIAAQYRQAIAGVKRINAADRALIMEVDAALIRTRGYDIHNGPT
ncbi:hypothetical protein [Arsukibacterium sp.]|uniref:hypothetical protein n=1 Tax=Arsukibacterium sp. TaxID=1977258 RepID=UPI002FD94E9D